MRHGGFLRIVLALVVSAGFSTLAMADDWVVDRLRGEALVRIDGNWLPLQRGDVVSDDSPIRSGEGSRVTFVRGAEAIELSGATEIRIFDQAGQRMTTVMQAYGSVTVEAERLQIQHFSIQTPFLAAIVKGTRFTVVSDDTQSSVDVSRGLVQVQDYVHGVATDITPGQSAVVSDSIVLDVSGQGKHAPMVTLDGDVVVLPESDAPTNPGNGNGNAFAYGHDADHGNSGQGNNGNGNAQDNSGQGNGNGSNGNGNGPNNDSGHGNSNDNSGQGNNGNGNAYGHDKGNGDDDKPGNGYGRDK